MTSYGFIITRHVNSEKTNKYWNHAVRSIRRFYPLRKIVIIDDNSNQDFVKADFEYKNVQIVKSEYPGRGELLPYYYFHKNKYFNNAVILHDSVFFHKRIHFERFKQERVIPLWQFDHDVDINETIGNCMRLSKYLNNANIIQKKLAPNDINIFALKSAKIWHGCFGVQSYINYDFLSMIQTKYNIFKLLDGVLTRADRCSLERIMGLIFHIESPKLYKRSSLFGDIWKDQHWGYSFESYCANYRYIHKPLVKVWTGR
jgi:hypothetical protein